MVSIVGSHKGSAADLLLGDFDAAMKGIKAKALVLPAQTDLYFRESYCLTFKPQTDSI